jgi:nicotinamidase-related amidase
VPVTTLDPKTALIVIDLQNGVAGDHRSARVNSVRKVY